MKKGNISFISLTVQGEVYDKEKDILTKDCTKDCTKRWVLKKIIQILIKSWKLIIYILIWNYLDFGLIYLQNWYHSQVFGSKYKVEEIVVYFINNGGYNLMINNNTIKDNITKHRQYYYSEINTLDDK